ncbi:sulfatase [Halobaculum sp. CBA1158]|uniref:sulfatase n=1 Tax=Halobaculum sp. CBA1158 TaxID=2904243 RepID=UPI001F21D8AF|nr:sulfatase [Halobaculum sp. CBA1158]UIP01055.1 sulfatase [Halobaculum sp. CBA1158]
MNIALITVDSLRADHVGFNGYDRDTTPTLDERADESHIFTDTVAHACATRPSFPSILTSTHGLLYGGFDHLADEQVPLSVPLSDSGYATAGFHSNPYLSAQFGYDRGFDHFSDSERDPTFASRLRRYVSENVGGRVNDLLSWVHTKTEEHAGVDVGDYYKDATTLTDEALEWVESVQEPWFLWVHYMDPHHPYIPPSEHQAFGEPISKRRGVKLRQRVLDDPDGLSESDWSDLVDLYDAEIRYTDAEIGRLLDGIGNATWAVTADHGEEFHEHGGFGHKNRFYEEHVHVPFMLGGVHGSGVHNHLVGLNDVPMTLLRLADVDVPDTYRGVDAREGTRDRVLGGWAGDVGTDLDRGRLMSRTETEKYIRDISDDTEEMYDLCSDPEESHNRTTFQGKSDHRTAVDSFIEEVKRTSERAQAVEISDDLENQLENLGYME